MLAKFGVPPNRIIDYLSLIGDTVDNVPGVSKCGENGRQVADPVRQPGRRDAENAAKVGGAVGEHPHGPAMAAAGAP